MKQGIKIFITALILIQVFPLKVKTEPIQVKEEINELFKLDENYTILGIKSDFPEFKEIGIALLKDREMYAKINGKLLGPFKNLGKDTPFFSPYTKRTAFTIYTDEFDHAVIDGEHGEKFLGLGRIIFSNDGKNYIYKAQTQTGQLVVLNGVKQREFKGIKDDPVFSPDGKKTAYTAFKNKKDAYVISGGKEYGPYKNVREIKFSPDSSKLAFTAFIHKGWHLVVDGRESKPYKNIMEITFSVNNETACVAQKKQKLFVLKNFTPLMEYKTIGKPVFSPDGKTLAYPAMETNKWQVIINGKKEAKFDNLGPVVFSKTGKNYGYAGIIKDKATMVINGKKQETFDSIGLIKFSEDENHHAYRARLKNKWFVIFDKKKGKSYLNVRQPIFNPVKNEIAYMAFTGNDVLMVRNNKEGKNYKSIGLPKFSPDGELLAYHATNDNKLWFYNINGYETKKRISGFISRIPIVFDGNKKLRSIGINNVFFVSYKCDIN